MQTEDELAATAEATSSEAVEAVEAEEEEARHAEAGAPVDKWTSCEEQRFFSALEAQGSHLPRIAAHVGSKSVAQVPYP